MPEVEISEIISSVVGLLVLLGFLWYLDRRSLKKGLEASKKEMADRLYELSILKELDERIGYSLNVENIIDVITGSLNQFIDYSVVSYILFQPEKLVFKAKLEKTVSRNFLNDVKKRMIESLSVLTGQDLDKVPTEEVLSGALVTEEEEMRVNSYFNIPLVIADKLVGVLTISDPEKDQYKEEQMTILYKLTSRASQSVSRLQEIISVEQGKLNSMVESMGEGLVMMDRDYRILVVNPAAKRFLGLKEGFSIFDLVKTINGRVNLHERLEESIKMNKTFSFDNVELNHCCFYQIVISPVKSNYGLKQGEILGAVIVFRDVTREKELDQLKADFSSMMVHELRTPIDGINKIADLIVRRQEVLSKEKIVSEYAPLIRGSATDMLRLVNNLLDASKIEAGKYEVVKDKNNLKELLKEKIEFYTPLAHSDNIELVSHIDNSIPEEFLFDRAGIGEVVTNLLSNAFKFTLEGGKVLFAGARFNKNGSLEEQLKCLGIPVYGELNFTKLSEDFVWLAIADNGSGIDAEKMSLIFNKFTEFRNSVRTKKGTGLGLFITKGIIEGHGGEILVSSKVGEGTTFILTLPIN